MTLGPGCGYVSAWPRSATWAVIVGPRRLGRGRWRRSWSRRTWCSAAWSRSSGSVRWRMLVRACARQTPLAGGRARAESKQPVGGSRSAMTSCICTSSARGSAAAVAAVANAVASLASDRGVRERGLMRTNAEPAPVVSYYRSWSWGRILAAASTALVALAVIVVVTFSASSSQPTPSRATLSRRSSSSLSRRSRAIEQTTGWLNRSAGRTTAPRLSAPLAPDAARIGASQRAATGAATTGVSPPSALDAASTGAGSSPATDVTATGVSAPPATGDSDEPSEPSASQRLREPIRRRGGQRSRVGARAVPRRLGERRGVGARRPNVPHPARPRTQLPSRTNARSFAHVRSERR